MQERIIPVICGPTAVGKTSMAVSVFSKRGFRAISADSMQVYRGMDIGTAKPDHEELLQLPHGLIDIRTPDKQYNAGAFFEDAVKIIRENPDCKFCIVGGTGLYLKTLINGFADLPPADEQLREQFQQLETGVLYRILSEEDPHAAAALNGQDRVRIVRALEVYRLTGKSITTLRENNRQPGFRLAVAGCIRDRDELRIRIRSRIEKMLEDGFLDEVQRLLDAGYRKDLPSMQGLGYAQMIQYLHGEIDFQAAVEILDRETCQFAHRQIKLFKQLPGMVWIHADDITAFEHYFSGVTG